MFIIVLLNRCSEKCCAKDECRNFEFLQLSGTSMMLKVGKVNESGMNRLNSISYANVQRLPFMIYHTISIQIATWQNG